MKSGHADTTYQLSFMRWGLTVGASLIFVVMLIVSAGSSNASSNVGTSTVMVLRVYFHDYTATSRYSKAQIEGFFGNLNTSGKTPLTVTSRYRM
jgi:hypothetical protein